MVVVLKGNQNETTLFGGASDSYVAVGQKCVITQNEALVNGARDQNMRSPSLGFILTHRGCLNRSFRCKGLTYPCSNIPGSGRFGASTKEEVRLEGG